jgi:mycoredoxin
MRSRRYLEKNNIEYDWIDIDHDQQGEIFVLKINHGMRSVPTILFPDGSILVEPSNEELKSRLVIG